jgi:hypothetical protein
VDEKRNDGQGVDDGQQGDERFEVHGALCLGAVGGTIYIYLSVRALPSVINTMKSACGVIGFLVLLRLNNF